MAGMISSNNIELLQTGNLADGTVGCQGRRWKVHRHLLATKLKWFDMAFFGSFAVSVSLASVQ